MDPAADRPPEPPRLEDAEETSSPRSLPPQQLMSISIETGERLKWTPELHNAFLASVDACSGPSSAKPKEVLEAMGVDGLTVSHVKSHLQKHRMNTTTTTTTAQPSASAASGGTPPAKRARLQQQVVESPPNPSNVQINIAQVPKLVSKAADPLSPTAAAAAAGTEAGTTLPDFERAIRQLKTITTSPATDTRGGVTSPLVLSPRSPSAFLAVGAGGGDVAAVPGNPLLNLAIPPGMPVMPPFAGMQHGSGQGMPPPAPVSTLPHPHHHQQQQGFFPHIHPALASIHLRGGGSTSNHTNAQSSSPNNWRQDAPPLPGPAPALQVNPAFPRMATAALDLNAANQLLRAMMQGEHVVGAGVGAGASLHPMPPPSAPALFAAAGGHHHEEVAGHGGQIPLPPGMRSRAGAGSASWPPAPAAPAAVPAPDPSPILGFMQRTEGLLQHLVTSALRLQSDHARLRDSHVQVAVRLEQQAAGIIEFNESLHQFAALHMEAIAALAAAGAGAADQE